MTGAHLVQCFLLVPIFHPAFCIRCQLPVQALIKLLVSKRSHKFFFFFFLCANQKRLMMLAFYRNDYKNIRDSRKIF